MPVYQELIDFEKAMSQLSEPPIFINDLTKTDERAAEQIRDMITTRYSSDMISLLPSCRCGTTKGEFAKDKTICPECNTKVKEILGNEIESAVWLRCPDGIAALMNPTIWMMLTDKFKKGRYSVLNWIIDTRYDPQVKKPEAIINKMIGAGIQQGWNYFVNNFDDIMAFMFSMNEFNTKGANDQHGRLYELIKRDRHRIFSKWLPLPSKTILIVEKTVFSIYVDEIVTNAVNAIQMLTSIDREFVDKSAQAKENRLARGFSALCDFYYSYLTEHVASKPGQIRRHNLGTRTNFSFRAVITSRTDPHDNRLIEAPWGVGLTSLRPMIINKLVNKIGMAKNAAVAMIYDHIEAYNEMLDGVMQEIINEFPDKKIPILLNRNPSLLQGSVLFMGIGNFKKNPKDRTIGLPIQVVKHLNADFDGDEVHCSIMLDKAMADEAYALDPMFSIYNMSKPLAISGNLTMSKPVYSSISSWLDS